MRNTKQLKKSALSLVVLSAFSLTGCDYISKRLPTGLFPKTKEVATAEAKQEIKVIQKDSQGNIVIEKVHNGVEEEIQSIIEPASVAEAKFIEPIKAEITTPSVNLSETVAVSSSSVITPEPLKIENSNVVMQPKVNLPTTNLKNPKPSSTLVHLEQQNMKEQLRNLEVRVGKITEILDKMSPAMTRLIGIESEVSNLSAQLQSLIEQNKQQQLAQAPIPYTTQPSFIEPAINQSHATVIEPSYDIQQIEPAAGISSIHEQTKNTLYKIRSGDHKGKTRLVFETDEKIIPHVNIDNSENIMAVIFEKNEIDERLEKHINDISNTSSLIKSAAILHHPDNNSALIAFDLKKSSNIIAEEYIAPGQESQFHRFVLDIKN